MQVRHAVGTGLGLALLALCGQAFAQGYYREGYAEVIRCESRDYRQIWCDAETRGGVRIVNQLSSTACVEGRTWGWDRRGVWVSGGCRGEFETGGGAPPPSYGAGYGGGGLVRCESRDFNQIYCDVDIRGGVRLVNQLSSSPCVEGRTWGADRRGLWVRDGCRGEFEVGHGGSYGGGLPIDHGGHRGQIVLCESRDNRYRHCPAGIRRGAELVRQLSDSNCTFNRSWGYDLNGVWVDRGCRGEFAVD